MKRYIILFILGLNTNVFAQYVINVTNVNENFEKAGNKETLKVNIYDNHEIKVLKDFSRFIKKELLRKKHG